jgi:poly(hydroxyalkanoate) depolymerase family esterase
MLRTFEWLGRHGSRLLHTLRSAEHAQPFTPPAPPPTPPAPTRHSTALHLPPWRNPGELQMLTYVPHNLPANAPLVVLMHGCGQDADTFATHSGWRHLASRHNFALLMPVQTSDNNPQTCFNWFRPGDTKRGHGEVESVAEMVRAMTAALHLDRERIYVTGLSAGGAMTAALLAAYPDLFAAGAVVAGLPVGSASNIVNALSRMSGRGGEHDADAWASFARRHGPPDYHGRLPRVSIWHGQVDPVVAPRNGRDVALQFAALHGLNRPSTTEPHHGIHHTSWGNAVELWELDHAAHVYPIPAEHGISAAHEIAKFWGLI